VSVPQEKIEQALEAARKDGNSAAVTELEEMLGGVRPTPSEGAALSDQGAWQEDILSGEARSRLTAGDPEGGIGTPPEQEGALSDRPSREPPPIETDEFGTGLSFPEMTPEQRTRRMAKNQYDWDKAWMDDPKSEPTREQQNEFMKENTDWRFGYGPNDYMGRQVILDQETGEPRWSALSPQQISQVEEKEKKRGTTTKASMGALGFGIIRPAANIAQGVDADIDRLNDFQRFLFHEKLPQAEKDRISELIVDEYGKDSKYVEDIGKLPANKLREYIEMNPENENVFENLSGDEWWEQRKEFAARLAGRLLGRGAFPVPTPMFGADDPGGALMGREAFQGIEYEGDKVAPAYAGASEDVRDWLSEASHTESIYESIVTPLLTTDEGVQPGDRLMELANKVIEKTYTEEQQAERRLPFFSEDVKVHTVWDLFNSDLYNDPNTKLPWNNFEAFALTFFESTPEMALSMGVTRGLGGLGAKTAMKETVGQTIGQIDKTRRLYAGRYGLIGGSGTEGMFVANAVESETRDTLNEVSMDKYREDPLFNNMVDGGMTEEAAKQVLVQDAANIASTMSFVSTVLVSGPMNTFIGRSAVGRVIKDKNALRRSVGMLGEPGSEGLQGLGEQLATEMGVVRIDPENPIFDNPNRYLEAFGGEAMVAGPFGFAAIAEPSKPVGINEADVEVARATETYMRATNDRFKWQTKISDPEHIANTTPNERLTELEQLETLQKVEARSLLDAEPVMRKHLEQQNTEVAKTELKMLGALKMRANAVLNDIAVAKSRRVTAGEVQQQEQQIVKDRYDLQKRVNENVLKLDDLERMSGAIETIQDQGVVDQATETELIKEGYARRTDEGQMVVLPKGKRALKELNRQARGLQDRLEKGYIGTEKRDPLNLIKREMIDNVGPVEREKILHEDPLTGTQNRRAFNERQENIDVREGETAKVIENPAPAVAVVDVDSLGWVNDNMSHSAGDRLLLAVSDALSEQKGVEVFRVGGDEFVVTGASQEQLETAMQAAAAKLSETEVAAGEDAVTPQITWGKGKTYVEADAEAITMKDERIARGVVAKKKEKAATYRVRSQEALFQKGDELVLTNWRKARDFVERGDSVEVLTPDGAVQGVVTNVTNKRGRPRVKVNVQGREFTFNPELNHLIINETLDRADLAWITGDAEYAQPGRDTFPQTLSDVQIGHMGKDGVWYADLAVEPEYVDTTPEPWWWESYSDLNFDRKVFMAPMLPKATQEEISRADVVRETITNGYSNLPPIHMVTDIAKLQRESPEIVKQIRAEGASMTGVRGYMDHLNPTNGIYIFVPNIYSIAGSQNFEQGVAETIMHELIGHYGVRGFFRNEADLRVEMHGIVDDFPKLAKHYAGRLGLDINDPNAKQLLGEEMVAYLAGEVMSGTIDMTPRQKTRWQRLMDWVKKAIRTMGLDRWSTLKKMSREDINDTKSEFWNDERIVDLLSSAQDFVRNGPAFEWVSKYDTAQPYMRDADIFQAGLITAIHTADKKLTGQEKKQLVEQGKYPDKASVPNEMPMFPDRASPNIYKQAIINAKKAGYMTDREITMSGLDPDGDFYLFRDASYGTLQRYLAQMNGDHVDPDWYRDVLPEHLVKELDDIRAAQLKNHIVGPLKPTGQDGGYDGDAVVYQYDERPSLNKVSAEAMRERIAEIMAMKIEPKKTQMTKEMLLAHMVSENAYRVFVEKQGRHPKISQRQAYEKLYGPLEEQDIFVSATATEEQKKEIADEIQRTRERGYDIGFDAEQDRWLDWAAHTTEYSEWSPQGSRYTRDFRVALIKTTGGGTSMGHTGHYDPNLMHIRTGEAELLEWDEMPELTFPNPKMQGKMLSLIELQSDWLQKLRKGFSSQNERRDSEEKYRENLSLLNTVGDQFGRGVAEDVWKVLDSVLTPIANLPDGRSPLEGGGLMPGLRERAREELGQAYEDLTADQKHELWKSHMVDELDKVKSRWDDADAYLHGVLEALPKLGDLPGSMDVRGFDTLDAIAMRRATTVLRNELSKATDTMQNTFRYAANQTELVEQIQLLKNIFGKRLHQLATDGDYGDGRRLPMIEYRLAPMLTEVYSILGADTNHISELMSGLQSREMATVRVPLQAVKDLNQAMTASFTPYDLVKEIVAASRISRHGDLAPGALTLTVGNAGDEFIDIKVVGNKADVAKAEQLVPKLIKTWIENHAADKLRINTQNREQRTLSDDVQGDYEFSELEDAYGLEEHDTDSSSSELSDYGVESFEEYEESTLPEIESEIINDAFENITESEWDDLEADNEGVSREGNTYRDALVIDDDGDVDNQTAEDELRDARDEYRQVLYEDDDLRMQAYDQVREQWHERGKTGLVTGDIPILWDDDGDPIDYVAVVIIAKNPGDSYDLLINGDEVDYDSDYDDAKELLSAAILDYYQNESIRPPHGALFGPDAPPAPATDFRLTAQEGPEAGPNWGIATGNLVENLSMMSDATQKMDKIFNETVTLGKRISNAGVHVESPLSRDEQWRPLALKYLIADAVRRGMGGVMWNNGLSSSTRGGIGMHDVVATSRIGWTKEEISLRGEPQEVYIIRSADMGKPIAVSKSGMVSMLGRDVTRIINLQEAGKLESPDVVSSEVEQGDEVPRDRYIIATTESGTQALYRRSDNSFLGFHSDNAGIDQAIQQDMEHYGRPKIAATEDLPTAEPLGPVTASGIIDSDMAGGLIHVITGKRPSGYTDTFSNPLLAGARKSYEDIMVRLWNKELKKFGVHISETYVKAKNMKKAQQEEGQPTMKSPTRDEQIAEKHGRLYVAELTGEMHGWVVMSEKIGPVVNDVWSDKSQADRKLTQYIDDNFGSDREGVKVLYFPITDEMREEFSGPTAPFHYDPTQDPVLKQAAKKFGYTRTPLRERYKAFKDAFGAEFIQGALDQFYGLRRALNNADVSDGSYISARLTTSLDSMMKGILEYGHPVWEEGIVSNQGKGLLEILQPILSDPSTWGMYMAGKRAKRLMLEGYGNLEPEARAWIDAAADTLDNPDHMENVFEILSRFHEGALVNHREVQAGDLTKAERDALTPLERKYWDSGFLAHAKRKNIKVRNAPRGRWQIFDWRVVLSDNPQKNIDNKYAAGTKWLKRKGVKTDAEARVIMDKLTDLALKKQEQANTRRQARVDAGKSAEKLIAGGREHLFNPSEIRGMVALGDKFGHFERVAKDYAEFNKKMLDFGEASGIIDPETRPMWENADYVPFYRVDDERLTASGLSPTSGIANQRAPIKRLHGGKNNMGDVVNNILMNITKIVDASVKNNAALEAVDALRGSGIVSKQPMDWKPELIPMTQVEKALRDRGVIVPDDQEGVHMSDIPAEALTGMQKMFAIKAPSGPGVISVMRNGKREYYYTDDMLLYRSLTALNKKAFGRWMSLFRGPKRLLTEWITIDPAFMIANFLRDTGSAYVIGRDGSKPILSAAAGFYSAITEDEAMRTMVSAGAAFENGYITGGDPNATRKMLRAAMKDPTFVQSVLDSPLKLYRAWKHMGSAIENANRIAVYKAARRAGKSKKRSAYEGKDLMDFSMGGDWGITQFLMQTVPFMNARAQGNYRLARGAADNPRSFAFKGFLVGLAGMALYLSFKDDERYKELEMWDKQTYFHWWIGDVHYRLPKPFEVGAIFNTIPEMMMEYINSEENDAGKELLRGFGHMVGETFSMNPVPQTVKPLTETAFNYNFFTKRPIVSYYESKRKPPEQYRYRTSPTMIEMARALPPELDAVSGKIRSPLHLQNLYSGYTGTLGRYFQMVADAGMRRGLEYPLPPSWEDRDYPVWGRFVRGDDPERRTKYESEVYRMLDKVTAIQGSLNFLEKTGQIDQYAELYEEDMPYIRIAKPLESIRENIQEVNRAIQLIYLSPDMEPDTKREEINQLEGSRNMLFKEAYKLRPGGEYNLGEEEVTRLDMIDLIDQFGVDDSTAFMRRIQEDTPDTYELLEMIQNDMAARNLNSLARASNEPE